jgi:predicted short-subunit dehydrogenase-like oxidoreductase (DUF2520 family)
MLPGMSARSTAKPRIAIVGAGNLASALAISLRDAGYVIEQIISRPGSAPLRRARRLGHKVGALAIAFGRAKIPADIVWFCVPDGAIAAAAKSLVEAADWSGKVAVHSSGALTSDELAVLRKRGAAVTSVHPLMTFVRGSHPALDGIPFAIEGDSIAVRTARGIVRNLRGHPFTIRKKHKEVYHAWGTFASPLLTALFAASERVAFAAGVNRKAARERMLPILRQTLTNYARLGAAESFSGPVPRGDAATVKKHLKVLGKIPQAQEIYIALTRTALRDLPARNRAALEKILRLR